ncbi:MAG TPA: PfkB family carbohydrate kinase, partial [Streptosporangiaceae bacterium]|nr:PfkB family carbohydrate kinase [Streptosporangiaceae bacterium]
MRPGDRVRPAAAPGRFGRLLHLGNVVVDIVVTVPALPERGGDVLASGAGAMAGGGFNVMAAAARQGLRAAYAGAHGTGPFGTLARAALAEEGIEVIQPVRAGLDTGFVLTMVETGGERTFLTSRGAEATLTAADLGRVSPAARDAIYLSGYGLVHDSNRAALLGWLARLGGDQLVFFDPGPLVGSIPAAALAAVLGRAGWLACNAREAAILTGKTDPRAAAAALAARAGPAGRPQVLVRTGPGGCLIARPGGEIVAVPGFEVGVVDTNGAGDAHS